MYVRTDPLRCPYRTIHLGSQGKSFRSTGEFASPLQGNSCQNGRAACPQAAAVRSISSCGVLFWSWGSCLLVMGRFDFVMGRFAAGPGGAASSLPDSSPHREGQRPHCPIRCCMGNEDVAPPIFLLSSHVDGVRLKFCGDSNCKFRQICGAGNGIMLAWRNEA